MKLEKVLIEKIIVVQGQNVREDFGKQETEDLVKSLISTQGNIQPLIVCEKDDNFELISGERRLRALKEAGFTEALCHIYQKLTDIERLTLMFHENFGRKNLSWSEEVKAIQKMKHVGLDITVDSVSQIRNVSKDKAWSLVLAIQAVEEFPDLIHERSRSLVIRKHKELKKLAEEQQDTVKRREIKIGTILKKEHAQTHLSTYNMVLEEMRQELIHFKKKAELIFSSIKQEDKAIRLSHGIWLKDEVQVMIEAAKKCEEFGNLIDKEQDCKNCLKEDSDLFKKCEFYHEEFRKRKQDELKQQV